MKSTFSVLFFVKKDKQKINGSYPIFVRITIDGVKKAVADGLITEDEYQEITGQAYA